MNMQFNLVDTLISVSIPRNECSRTRLLTSYSSRAAVLFTALWNNNSYEISAQHEAHQVGSTCLLSGTLLELLKLSRSRSTHALHNFWLVIYPHLAQFRRVCNLLSSQLGKVICSVAWMISMITVLRIASRSFRNCLGRLLYALGL